MIRFCMSLLLLAGPVSAQVAIQPQVAIELNALNPVEAACRLVFVAQNGLQADISGFVIEAVAFDAEGSVARIALFDFADLPAGIPRVRQFDLPDTACDSITSILVNGVQSCEGPADCATSLAVSSRTNVELLG